MFKFANLVLVAILVLCLKVETSPIGNNAKLPKRVQTISEGTTLTGQQGNSFAQMMVTILDEDEHMQETPKSTAVKKRKLQPSMRGAALDSNFVTIETKKVNKVQERKAQIKKEKTVVKNIKKSQKSGNKYL